MVSRPVARATRGRRATTFVFKRNQTIGAASAELDAHFLRECFVDTGDLRILQDCTSPQRIVVGSTGAGKSALLSQLAEVEEHVIQIQPEALSLGYITNSVILRPLVQLGTDLDIFFRLLWRHVFVVEILKAKFGINDEGGQNRFYAALWQLIPKNQRREKAIEYLRKWGSSFWQDTEYRIKEITEKLETDLKASIGVLVPSMADLAASGSRAFTEEKKIEVIRRAQEVVNGVQIRELSEIMTLLADTLKQNPQQKFFVIIDKLDEDWIEDGFRYRMIRALITTATDFALIPNAKIVVSVRQDLLERVFRFTRAAGFQEEKLKSALLQVRWNRHQLQELLDRRIGTLVKDQYTNRNVGHKELLPGRVDGKPGIDYVLDRTLMRPRDVIQFFNECISHSEDRPTVSARALREAEGAYSRDRLRAIGDEWVALYPNMFHLAKLVRGRPAFFRVGDVSLREVETNVLEFIDLEPKGGLDWDDAVAVLDDRVDLDQYRTNAILALYKMGIVGLKVANDYPISWSYETGVTVSRAEVDASARVHIHPAFWRTLGTRSQKTEDD